MCDERTEAEALTRRDLARLSVGAAVLMATPALADNADSAPVPPVPLSEREVTITTADGRMDACLIFPVGSRLTPVLTWPNIRGLTPGARAMARTLAQQGYAVLVLNPYYRSQKAPVVSAEESFSMPEVRDRLYGFAGLLTDVMTDMDAGAALNFLSADSDVDISRGAAVIGYCMGGPRVLRTAALRPDLIRFGGSFHGGGLVTDKASSPHLLIPRIKADLLIAIAQNDDEKSPADKDVLRQACKAAGVAAEIEVYNALHGWTAPDGSAYDPAEAARAHGRLAVHLTAAFAQG